MKKAIFTCLLLIMIGSGILGLPYLHSTEAHSGPPKICYISLSDMDRFLFLQQETLPQTSFERLFISDGPPVNASLIVTDNPDGFVQTRSNAEAFSPDISKESLASKAADSIGTYIRNNPNAFPFAGLYINSSSELSLMLSGEPERETELLLKHISSLPDNMLHFRYVKHSYRELEQALSQFSASCEKVFPDITASPLVYFGIQESLNGICLCINENASESTVKALFFMLLELDVPFSITFSLPFSYLMA